MVTDRYQHETSQSWFSGGRSESLPVDGIDNLPGSVPLESFGLPRRCVLLFGQEGPGLSRSAHEAASAVCSIAQFGSTRSINAGAAAAIAMHTWIRQHADLGHDDVQGE